MTPVSADMLPILIAPHPILRTKARAVTAADDAEVQRLVPRMFRAMYDAPGIGLAAPQVGIGLRVVVIDLAANDTAAPMVLINPTIVSVSDRWATREEGCLSLPGQYADVSRPAAIRIRYRDLAGQPRDVEAVGLFAACLLHELDHLDGVLFVDHLTPLKRNMLLRRLAKDVRLKAAS